MQVAGQISLRFPVVAAADPAAFEDADHALRWAARVDSTLAITLPQPYSGKGEAALTGAGKGGQAARIAAIVTATMTGHPACAGYIAARYWRRVEEGLPLMRPFIVAGLSSGIHKTRAIDDMVRNCFPVAGLDRTGTNTVRQHRSMRSLREEMRCRMAVTVRTQHEVKARLYTLHEDTLDRLDEAFRAVDLLID